MRNILVEIHCKQCFYHTHIKSHTQVIVAFEPHLKEAILNHTMFMYHCPRCGSKILFLHNFLYSDHQHHFHVYMSQASKDLTHLHQQFPQDTICQVNTTEDLAETIRMLENGLDVNVLQNIKITLQQREDSEVVIRYQDVDDDMIWFHYTYRDREEMKGIAYSIYQAMQAKGGCHNEERTG